VTSLRTTCTGESVQLNAPPPASIARSFSRLEAHRAKHSGARLGNAGGNRKT